MMRLVRLGFSAALFVVLGGNWGGTAAHAQSCSVPVSVSGNWASGSALGNMSTARSMGDIIGCEVFAPGGGPAQMYCYAQAGGVSRFCFSTDPALVTAATAITSSSFLYFSWASGNCNYVTVQTFSCN